MKTKLLGLLVAGLLAITAQAQTKDFTDTYFGSGDEDSISMHYPETTTVTFLRNKLFVNGPHINLILSASDERFADFVVCYDSEGNEWGVIGIIVTEESYILTEEYRRADAIHLVPAKLGAQDYVLATDKIKFINGKLYALGQE